MSDKIVLAGARGKRAGQVRGLMPSGRKYRVIVWQNDAGQEPDFAIVKKTDDGYKKVPFEELSEADQRVKEAFCTKYAERMAEVAAAFVLQEAGGSAVAPVEEGVDI